MAINLRNYVDITTVFPDADVAARAFGGLVLTAKDMIPPPSDASDQSKHLRELYAAYNEGKVVYLSLNECSILFNKGVYNSATDTWTTPADEEYAFATGYYGYMSPSGRFASRLAFCKILKKADDTYETPLDAFKRADMQPNIAGFGSVTCLSASQEGGSSDSSDGDAGLQLLKDLADYNQGDDMRCKYLIVVNNARGEQSAETVANNAKEFKDYKNVCFVSGCDGASGYMPMSIFGSTDYNDGQVVNFMFKQFPGEKPTVLDDDTYTKFNEANVNFYGRTQTNGQTLDFYQRGFNTDGVDTAICCNEIWFKAACESALIQVLMGRERIPANDVGVAIVNNTVTEQCLKAVANGAFMPKATTASDVRFIAEMIQGIGGSFDDAERIATNIGINGYSVYATLRKGQVEGVMGSQAEYYVVYYVFYGTADSIRYIKGTDVLI